MTAKTAVVVGALGVIGRFVEEMVARLLTRFREERIVR